MNLHEIAKVNLICGPNGSGKTELLRQLSMKYRGTVQDVTSVRDEFDLSNDHTLFIDGVDKGVYPRNTERFQPLIKYRGLVFAVFYAHDTLMAFLDAGVTVSVHSTIPWRTYGAAKVRMLCEGDQRMFP